MQKFFLFSKNCKIKFVIICLVAIIFCMQNVYGEWPDRFGPSQQVNLSTILKNPENWLNVPVRIPIRFAWFSNVYVPFRTKFTRDQYLNFAGWDVKNHVWTEEGFNNIHPHFYVPKDNPELKSFLKLNAFNTICILGKIESIFAGKAFIRVVWYCKLPGQLNIDNLRMINSGLKLYRSRKFKEAFKMFQKIVATDPPNDIKAMMYKAIAKYYMYEKKAYYLANDELSKAWEIAPNDIEVKKLLKRCALYLWGSTKILITKVNPANPNVRTKQVIEEGDDNQIILEQEPAYKEPKKEPDSKEDMKKIEKKKQKKTENKNLNSEDIFNFNESDNKVKK